MAQLATLTEAERKARAVTRERRRYANNRTEILVRAAAYRETHREQIRASMRIYNRGKVEERRNALLAKYGLTAEDYLLRLAVQDGCCAICHKSPRADRCLAIDHDHVTGKVRGLLCERCNNGMGALGDTPEGLLRALAYLRRHLDGVDAS